MQFSMGTFLGEKVVFCISKLFLVSPKEDKYSMPQDRLSLASHSFCITMKITEP